MRVRKNLLVATALNIALLSGCVMRMKSPETLYIYPLNPAPPSITEEVALAKASETMFHQGFDMEKWQVHEVKKLPAQAPDRAADKYFIRFSPKPGLRVGFGEGRKTRRYDVWLQGGRVICASSWGY